MDVFGGAANGIAGLFGGVYNGILNQQAMDWLRGAYTNNLNFGRQQYGDWMNRYDANADPIRNTALGLGGILNPMVSGAIPSYMDRTNSLYDQIPGLFEALGGNYANENTDAAGGGLRELLGGANSIFGDRGWTPQNYRLFDQGQEFATGNNDPMRGLSNIGQYLLNSGGATDLNQRLQERAMNTVDAGGYTNPLINAADRTTEIQNALGQTEYTQGGIGAALQMLLGGGMTPELQRLNSAGADALTGNLGVSGLTNTGAVGELAALSGIQGGGETATSRALQQKALEILKTNPTMSIEDAVSAARDAAATAAAQQGQAVRARALARGGGPGSVVATGSQNEAMADFADQAMRAESSAGNNARASQQAILMDYLKSGAGMAEASGGLERGTLGTYADLLKGLEGVAASRFGTGGSLLGQGTALATDRANTGFSGLSNLGNLEANRLLTSLGLSPTIQNSATNNAGTIGQLGLGASGDATSRLGLGTNMLNSWLSTALNGLNSSASANSSAQNYGLGAGQLAGNTGSALGNLGLGTAGQGLNNFNTLFNGLNTSLNQQGQGLGAGMNGLSNLYFGPLSGLTQMSGNLMNTFGSNTSGLPGLPSNTNAFAGLGAPFNTQGRR